MKSWNMLFNRNRILFLLFFISGFCSLLYQVVWLRLAYAYFGIITPVMSLVISVFMLGLALGSWFGGKWILKVTQKTGVSAIYLYALTELLIGLGALVVARLFSYSGTVLLSAGEMDSFRYLLASAILIALSILPWCVLMGFTFPFMMAFVREVDNANNESFSFLYLANVLGAMSGTLLTALILIEVLGFEATLMAAAISNVLIAVVSIMLGAVYPYKKVLADSAGDMIPAFLSVAKKESSYILTVLFTTGFTSMSMEVVWVRAFTPVFGTTIYSFASLLAVYLLATFLGSHLYRSDLKLKRVTETSQIITLLAAVSFLPILLSDPKLWEGMPAVVISIFPLCSLLGYLTPKLIDQYSGGTPDGAGAAYAVNIMGCIIGPAFASYVLLPFLGVKASLIILAIPYVILLVYCIRARGRRPEAFVLRGVLAFIFLFVSIFVSDSYEEYYKKNLTNSVVRRDYAATVISYGSDLKKALLVNGVGITSLCQITKNMAHLPLSFLKQKPESALVICFGMGTTYRSLMSWDINVTAVELVPSVKEAFSYYFSDAETVERNPKGHIIIDDGRRFLSRTSETYDAITIDPPPPIEAAGSSLLYSEGFYALAKKHLKKEGILQQWFPGGEKKIFNAIARSLVNSFPYVKAFKSDSYGVHFIASMIPLKTPTIDDVIMRLPDGARKDLTEWSAEKDLRTVVRSILAREVDMKAFLNDDKKIVITDDKPFNEYFLLRRLKADIYGNYLLSKPANLIPK